MERKRLFVIDGSGYIYRAFYAMPSLTTAEGLSTGAIYGFVNMLLKLRREEQPDYLAVVFDPPGGSRLRKELFPEYKANRPPPPPELGPQLPLVREVTRAMAVPQLEAPGYEADDVIATLVERCRSEDVETIIVSSDKDLMQLVEDGQCRMLDTLKDVSYDAARVVEKLGVQPTQVIDYLALLGDKVDNIPGVPGIGKKTATTLLETWGDLDGIYAHIDEQKGKRKENLVNNRDSAYMSQQLATCERNVPLEMSLEACTPGEPDRDALARLFERLEFRTLLRQIQETSARSQAPGLTKDGYESVREPEALRALAETLRSSDGFALAALSAGRETDARFVPLVGLAFCVSPERAWYVPVGHARLDAHPQLPETAVLDVLGPLLADATIPKIARDAKLLTQQLARAGVGLAGVAMDVRLASYMLDPDKYTHTLANIARDRLTHARMDDKDLLGRGRKRVGWDEAPVASARDWLCEEVQLTKALHAPLVARLVDEELTSLYEDLELPLQAVLGTMELAGIKADIQLLGALSRELTERTRGLEAKAHELAGGSFSINSPKQVGQVLFERLGLPPGKKTKTGYSTGMAVLQHLADAHPLPAVILQWRQADKLRSTYTDVLPTLVNHETGRIHTHFNQAVAATGRLSSQDPNLQNIPVRTEDGRRIREAFIAEEGHVLLAADYSQIELRIMAHLSGDEAMQQAFKDGADIHMRTARELFGVDEESVTRSQRAMAKTINFGILYGMSAFRLANEQNMSREEAVDMIKRYFGAFPRVRDWQETTLDEARRTGQVATLLGRVRHVREINARNGIARSAAERIATNAPVQGSAADIIKQAMVILAPKLAGIDGARMLLQVHDELVFEVPEASAPQLAKLVRAEMSGVVELAVPLDVNTAWGLNWLEAH